MNRSFYELTYIVNPVLEEENIKQEVEKVTSFVNENGATIDEVNEWGIKSLAYEMDGKKSGYYVNMYFESAGELIVKLERFMQLNDNILRYLTLKYDNKMLRHRELLKKGEVPRVLPVVEEEGKGE